MQVYAVIKQGEKVIITKKAELNTSWGSGINAVVNQAGQYALPGGKQENKESVVNTAMRETLEETGYEIPKDVSITINQDQQGLYQWITFELPKNVSIDFVAQTIQNHIEQGIITEDDREHASVLLINKSQIDQYLGIPQNVSEQNQKIIEKKQQNNPYSQAIDWYADIAQILKKL
jgi:8-oxo-dGTP pyrophosphatase MutT (NUDIX family)